MSASQCGMPIIPIGRSGFIRKPGEYSAGSDCIGDLLSDSGYELSYVGGSDLEFAGKGRFYKNHGFGATTGVKELSAEFGADLPKSDWGAFDDLVFAKGRTEFQRLAALGDPFGLFLLTTASHPPSGYPSPSCVDRNLEQFNKRMLDAIHCSDAEAYEFIRWIQSQKNENLLIVIASDHVQVAGDLHELLKMVERRENFFVALGDHINPAQISRTATTLDIAPTLAGLLGFPSSGMGLGRNLLSESPTLAEKYGAASFDDMTPRWRLGLDAQPIQNIKKL